MVGISNSRMNCFRLRGSTVLDTCSADTTVPWMTRMSSSASAQALARGEWRRGAHDPVRGGAEQRQLEAERVELPGDVDVLGVAGAPARDDRDVVEAVRLTPGLVDTDFTLGHGVLRVGASRQTDPRRCPNLPDRKSTRL